MRIVEAANGQEALESLAREPFDIVLLDMHMPIMDGPATIKGIRESGEAWSAIPVIALTADAMSGDRERYLGLGMNGYLSKPLAERDLLTEIARVLTGRVLARLVKSA
jgi:CheY-like chemotaxis protein